ncbi:MAG: hypothetical protein JWQ95_4298, partial [Sphaerisporangium sp.]|nr:hypothetical protein [Sphaerisporangium sp.]
MAYARTLATLSAALTLSLTMFAPASATPTITAATTSGTSPAAPAKASGKTAEVRVLGNRADLISGGQALIEVVPPPHARNVRVQRNGKDVTSAFGVRADGRYYGLVEGLVEGRNTVTARVAGAPDVHLTVTNHPIGGPVISGAQVQPWFCTTKVVNPTPGNPDLGDPLDAQCNIAAPVYRYSYRALNGSFATYDPASPPPASEIATVTTDEGVTVPYIVRIERGVINRGKYDVAYLANPNDPTQGWSPWDSSPSWNNKLFWKFGSGCEYGRTQANPGNVLDDIALRRGFMVASSEMTQYGTHCNDVASAETVIMLKEHITEAYGEIRYTMSDGSSGGAHQQHLHASNYPGLLQGILPSQGWQDTWTTGREFADCGLLKRYYDSGASSVEYTNMDRAHIDGHRWNQVCEGPAEINMAGRTAAYLDPTVGGAGCGTIANRWSPTNLRGIRCTLQDYNIAVFGPRDKSGYAKSPLDNVGIQYGLEALNKRQITVEQFLQLNKSIGGYDINGQWQPQRMEADPGAAEIAHRSGRVTYGRGLGEVAILADVAFNITEEHYDFRTWVTRNRIANVYGDYDNQVIWRHKGNPPDYDARRFDTMNEWLARVEADTSNRSLRTKIIADKPDLAVDSCWRASAGWVTDPAVCNTAADPSTASSISGTGANAVYQPADGEWPVFRDTRVAAGAPLASDIMKCRLEKPKHRDYTVTFTTAQWARLQAVFPSG